MRVKLSWAFEGDDTRSSETVDAASTVDALIAKVDEFDRAPVYLSASKVAEEQPCAQP